MWRRFRADMYRPEPGDWMFVRPGTAGQPPNVGYGVGYHIARTHYERAADNREAIREILGLTDFDAFLRSSGYGERVSK